MRYRTIRISDVDLGTQQCDAEALVNFWSLRRQPYWPHSYSDVIRKVLSTDGELALALARAPAAAAAAGAEGATGR